MLKRKPLSRVVKPFIPCSLREGDSYRCCRWCHYARMIEQYGVNETWACTHPAYVSSAEVYLPEYVSESVNELVEESLSETPSKEEFVNSVMTFMQEHFRASKARQEEARSAIQEFFEILLRDWENQLGSDLHEFVKNKCDDAMDKFYVEITDPYNHCCEGFW